MKEKSKPLEADGDVTVGFDAGAFEGKLSKKLPPLKGGGEVTTGAEGVAFGAATGLVMLPKAEKADDDCGAGDLAVLVLGKLNPLKASARPPNASCFAGDEVTPPNEGWRSCWGWGAG